MGYRLYCWGCGKTFGSYRSLRSHISSCYWYRWHKENGILDDAPFHPDQIYTSLEFMRGRPVEEGSIPLRYPKGHPKREQEIRNAARWRKEKKEERMGSEEHLHGEEGAETL